MSEACPKTLVQLPENLIELVVSEVRAAVPMSPGQEAGLAVLAEPDEPFRCLYIYIGQAEARAIQAGQRGLATAPALPRGTCSSRRWRAWAGSWARR